MPITHELDTTYPGGAVHPGWVMLVKAILETPGAKTSELAQMVGVSTYTIKKWQKDPAYNRFALWYTDKTFLATPPYRPGDTPPEPVSVRAPRLKEEISEFAVEMFDRLKDIVETTENEQLVVTVAKDVLDRAGHAPIRKVVSEKRAMVLTPEALQMLEQRAKEAGTGPIIEAETVPSTPGSSDPSSEPRS